MGIKLTCDGYKCKSEIKDGDSVYCESCYNNLQENIDELVKDIDCQDDEISSLNKSIVELEKKIKELEWKKETITTITSTEKVDKAIADGLKTEEVHHAVSDIQK